MQAHRPGAGRAAAAPSAPTPLDLVEAVTVVVTVAEVKTKEAIHDKFTCTRSYLSVAAQTRSTPS